MNATVKNSPYWTDITQPPTQYPWLDKNVSCDVAIVGSGIVGSMCAERLTSAGISTVLIGNKPIGHGSTAYSQGVVNYCTESGLTELASYIGIDNAVKVFKLCEDSINNIESLCEQSDIDTGFMRVNSLYYTGCESNIEKINKEFLARHHNGFTTEFVNSEKAHNNFSFPVSAGIVSTGITAVFNPYLLTHSLVKNAAENGAQIYENTSISIISGKKDNFRLQTASGKTINAKKVIMATGLESHKNLPSKTCKKLTFTVVTKPVSDFSGWLNRSALCSADRKRVRLRTTDDNRVIISGYDNSTSIMKKTAKTILNNGLFKDNYEKLNSLIISMFPGIRDVEPEYQYHYEYLDVNDNLPVIGESENPGIYYAMCPGENGTAFANIAADMILAHYQCVNNPLYSIFAPNRFKNKVAL